MPSENLLCCSQCIVLFFLCVFKILRKKYFKRTIWSTLQIVPSAPRRVKVPPLPYCLTGDVAAAARFTGSKGSFKTSGCFAILLLHSLQQKERAVVHT